MTGKVSLRLYKGNILSNGAESPYSLYNEEFVTFGEDGSLAWDGERFYVGGIEKAEVVNTVGAGDSFIAGFLYGILNGKSIDECLKKGAEVAASVVQVFEPWVE